MAINPFRVGELQLPQPLRPVPIDFSPLSQIGESIGQYRQQQQIGEILRGATDESGNLDIQKAASGLGAAGHLGAAQRLIDTATRQSSQQAQEATARRGQDITKAHYKATQEEAAARTELEARRVKLEEEAKKEGTLYQEPNPLGIGAPTYRKFNRATGAMEVAPIAPAPSTIGPRSDIAPSVMPTASFAERFDPENAPPTRVAAVGPAALPGPTAAPQAAPVQTAQAAPANPAMQQFEQQYGPQATGVLKDILEYKRGPLKGHEEAWKTLARQVDPNYDPLEWDRREKESKTAPRQFGFGDIEKLTEKGTNVRDTQRFLTSFKPEFAGYGPFGVGEAAMAAGRFLPEGTARKIGANLPEAASWWQDYENFKNAVRKGTFGATLTGLEKQAFERANVSPGMDAKQITKFLNQQNSLITDAIKREANAQIAAGYDPKVISNAFGLDLKELGVTAESSRKTFGDIKVPTDAANDLIALAKEGDTPALRQQFDQVFGKGAADYILKRPAR